MWDVGGGGRRVGCGQQTLGEKINPNPAFRASKWRPANEAGVCTYDFGAMSPRSPVHMITTTWSLAQPRRGSHESNESKGSKGSKSMISGTGYHSF